MEENLENPIIFYEIPDEIKLEGEIFIPAIRYNDLELLDTYYVSNYGRIFSKYYPNRGIILTPQVNHKGYHVVTLGVKGEVKRANVIIHRLEMAMFCPIPNMHLYQVNHKDGNKTNNRLDNLEWCTASYNVRHAYSTGLMDVNKLRSLKDEEIKNIREQYLNGVPTVEIWKNNYKNQLSYESISGICRNRTYVDPNYIVPKPSSPCFSIEEVNFIRKMYNDGYNITHIWKNYSPNKNKETIRRICLNQTFFDPNYVPRNDWFKLVQIEGGIEKLWEF